MLKTVARSADGQAIIILGLSHMNLEKLKEGMPIDIDLSSLNLKGHILIFSGETEQTMITELVKVAGQGGAVIYHGAPPKQSIDPREKK